MGTEHWLECSGRLFSSSIWRGNVVRQVREIVIGVGPTEQPFPAPLLGTLA